MICQAITQSVQLPITLASSVTGCPRGSRSAVPAVREPGREQRSPRVRRIVRGESLRFSGRFGIDPAWPVSFDADRVDRRRISVFGFARERVPVDRHADRGAQRNQAVRVAGDVEEQPDGQGRRGVEEVEMHRVVGDVRPLDVRDERKGEIDASAAHLHQCRVPRGRKHALDAGDVRSPLQPVVGVSAKHIALVAETLDARERSCPDRLWVRPGADVADLREDMLRDDAEVVREDPCDEGRVAALESDRDLVLSHELDRDDLASRPRETDLIHGLVALAGRQREEDVPARQRLSVRPANAAANRHDQRPGVLAPTEVGREPLVFAAAARLGHHDQRLVDPAPGEVDGGLRVGVEVPRERRVAHTRNDEAAMPGGGARVA